MNIYPCGMPASPQDWACRLLAATRFQRPADCRVGKAKPTHRSSIPPYGPSSRGDGAPQSAKSLWLVPYRHAGASWRANRGIFSAAGLALVRSVALECAGRAFSQLLAGTPSGPGRSSAAARVPRCDEARGRRTSSRFTTPHDRAPQWTRWGQHKRGSRDGDRLGILP